VFVALLCLGVVAAWSFGLYLWLLRSMEAMNAAFVVGFVLLALAFVAVLAGRWLVRGGIGRFRSEPRRPGPGDRFDAVAGALEAVGGMAKTGRPFSALLTAAVLGVAAGYFAEDK
jgi:hypothetical protein